MNDNKLNFTVNRTTGGTICEVVTAVLAVVLWGLAIYAIRRHPGDDSPILVHAVAMTTIPLMMLLLAYFPRTFNVPDNAKPMHYVLTVWLLRVISVELVLMGIVDVVGIQLLHGPTWISHISATILLGTIAIFMVRFYTVK